MIANATNVQLYWRYAAFLLCLVAIGFLSRTDMGTDGPLGVVVGLAIASYSMAGPRRPPEDASAIRRLVDDHPAIVAAAGLLLAAMGLLDALGKL